MDPYGSHLLVNSLLLEYMRARHFSRDLLIEFGMGNYSTVLFSKYAQKVISYEMQDMEWLKKMSEKNLENVKLLLSLGPKAALDHFDTLAFCIGAPAYVFVDGHQDSRHLCIQKAMEMGTPYIVFHDSEQACYHYDEIKVLPGYTWIDVRDLAPWTSVLTKDPEAVKMLQMACLNTFVR